MAFLATPKAKAVCPDQEAPHGARAVELASTRNPKPEPKLGTWNLELGTWNLEPGTWNWSLEPRT
jgi:hypothetical protein